MATHSHHHDTFTDAVATDGLVAMCKVDKVLGSVVGQSAESPGFDCRRRKSVGHRWNL